MPRKNTTGLPQTGDYNLGRGIIYAARIDETTGLPMEWRDLGNAPEFNISIEAETLEHQSSRSGLRVTDKEVPVSIDASLAFTLDEINAENVADWFRGEQAVFTNGAVAGFAEWEMVPEGEIVLGRWYDIRSSTGVRAYGIDGGDLTVKTTNITPVELAEGTDYDLDAEFGRIFLRSTSTKLATAISGEEGLDVTLAANAGAPAVNEIRGLTQASTTVAIKFVSENASGGAKAEWEFHQVTLTAEGDFGLISDDWTQMQFTGACEANELGFPNSPTLTIRTVASAA